MCCTFLIRDPKWELWCSYTYLGRCKGKHIIVSLHFCSFLIFFWNKMCYKQILWQSRHFTYRACPAYGLWHRPDSKIAFFPSLWPLHATSTLFNLRSVSPVPWNHLLSQLGQQSWNSKFCSISLEKIVKKVVCPQSNVLTFRGPPHHWWSYDPTEPATLLPHPIPYYVYLGTWSAFLSQGTLTVITS